MRRLSIAYVLMTLFLIACDGGDESPVDGAAGDAVPGDAGDACSAATEGSACAVEGASCGGPCTDACSFCNILRCESGIWTRYEAFPAPCFDCGAELRCISGSQYCRIEHSDIAGEPDVFACPPMPEPCTTDTTCECLSMAIPDGQCTGELAELTVEISGG